MLVYVHRSIMQQLSYFSINRINRTSSSSEIILNSFMKNISVLIKVQKLVIGFSISQY